MFPSKGFSYTVLNELLSVFWQRYLDRLVDSLQQKLKISEKMVSSRKIVVEKRQTAAKEQMNLEPKLDIIRSKTKELQWQVRGWLIEKHCKWTASFWPLPYSFVFRTVAANVWNVIFCEKGLALMLFNPCSLNILYFYRLLRRSPRNIKTDQSISWGK